MPHSAIEQYMGKLNKYLAMWRLMMGEAAKVPYMEDDDRREWASDVEEKLNDGRKREKVAPAAILKMLGIGIRK